MGVPLLVGAAPLWERPPCGSGTLVGAAPLWERTPLWERRPRRDSPSTLPTRDCPPADPPKPGPHPPRTYTVTSELQLPDPSALADWHTLKKVVEAGGPCPFFQKDIHKMKTTTRFALGTVLVLTLALTACSGSSAKDKLIGSWTADFETFEAQNPDVSKNPMAKLAVGMLGSMKLQFTADKMTAEILGQKKDVGYEVVSTDASSVTITATDGDQKGAKTTIKFIDANHMSMHQEGKPGPAMVMKKI